MGNKQALDNLEENPDEQVGEEVEPEHDLQPTLFDLDEDDE